jgi:competence protein ComEC
MDFPAALAERISKLVEYCRPSEPRLWGNPLLLCLLAMAGGIVFQHCVNLPISVLLVSTSSCILCLYIMHRRRDSQWLLRITAGAALSLFAATLCCVEKSDERVDEIGERVTDSWQPILVDAVVRGPLRYRPNPTLQTLAPIVKPISSLNTAESVPPWSTIIPLEIEAIYESGDRRVVFGRTTLVIDVFYEDYLPGDRLRIAGRMIRIGEPRNPGEPDYQEWMRSRGEETRMRADNTDSIERLDSMKEKWFWSRTLAWIGREGNRQLRRYISEPQGSLAAALLLGQREQVDRELTESLLATGTIHLLSISGLHVEMIAVSLLTVALILRLPRRLTLLITAILIVLYAMVTGSNPPVVRATVLILGFLAGRWFGRSANAFNLLGLAGCLLLLYQPSLLFDLGSQLSFLAVFCLVLLSGRSLANGSQKQTDKKKETAIDVQEEDSEASNPARWIFNRLRRWWRNSLRPTLDSAIAMNVGVWLATTPLVLYHFNVVSPIALLLNVLLWFPVLIALLSGLGVMLLGWIPGLGRLLGKICEYSLASVEGIVNWGASIDGGHVWLPAPSEAWLTVAYGLLAVSGIWLIATTRRRFLAVVILSSWLLIGCWDGVVGPAGVLPLASSWIASGVGKSPSGEMRIQFLDVGHGSAVILRMPDGTAWLYDAGKLGDRQQGYRTISQSLWELRVARLSGMILSHADSDHYSAMPGLLRRFPVDRFVTGPGQWQHPSVSLQELKEELIFNSIAMEEWSGGQRMEIGKVGLRVLHPEKTAWIGSDNAKSLCLVVEYAGRSIFLPGDLESPGTQEILQLPSPQVDVLMAPHHGSLAESPEGILKWSHAGVVIISGSARANSPAVQSVYASDNRKLLITARDRAVEIRIAADGKLTMYRWDGVAWVAA